MVTQHSDNKVAQYSNNRQGSYFVGLVYWLKIQNPDFMFEI